MNEVVADELKFKFHWLDENGNATSMFRKSGHFSGITLILEDTELTVAIIVQSVVRDEVMALTLATGDDDEPYSSIAIKLNSKSVASQLKEEIDIARSAVWAEMNRKELEEKGEGHRFRSRICPTCNATLVLTDMPDTPQLYCHFCDALTTIDSGAEPIPQETELRICEECGMYSRPQKFTVFYFYFLIFFYGFWSKPTWKCPPCMRSTAWRMVFGNFFFVLGFPFAVIQLFRSYGGSSIGGKFRGLDSGNIKALKGNLAGAVEKYRAILDRVPNTAGVKYNIGMALLAQQNFEKAASSFELALKDCSNYNPAYEQLCVLYQHLGETEKLEELQKLWDTFPEEQNPEEEDIQHYAADEPTADFDFDDEES